MQIKFALFFLIFLRLSIIFLSAIINEGQIVGFFYPQLDNACDVGLAYYFDLPLELHTPWVTDDDQMSPDTADQCAQGSYNRMVHHAYAGKPIDPGGEIALYQSCEYAFMDMVDTNQLVDEIVDYTLQQIPREMTTKLSIERKHFPRNLIKVAVNGGDWDSTFIQKITYAQTNDKRLRISLHFYDNSTQDSEIVSFIIP